MIIWSGWGFLVAVVVFATSLAMEFVTEALFGDDRFYQVQTWPLALALAIAGVIIWKIGAYFRVKGAQVVIDKATGQELTLAGDHRFFFVPMHYWGPVLIASAVVTLILR